MREGSFSCTLGMSATKSYPISALRSQLISQYIPQHLSYKMEKSTALYYIWAIRQATCTLSSSIKRWIAHKIGRRKVVLFLKYKNRITNIIG